MIDKGTYTLNSGGVVTVETSNPEHGTVAGEMKLENLHWNNFFDDDLNEMFSRFKSPMGNNMFVLDDEGNIGMWMTIRDIVTNEEYTDYIYRECLGTLMVIIYIMMQCMHFRNSAGHPMNFVTDEGVAVFYNRFIELVEEESEPQMRRFFTHTGGYVESFLSVCGDTPEDVLDIIDDNIN